MKQGKILIIDDNEDVLFALNLLLEPYVEQIRVTHSRSVSSILWKVMCRM